MFLNEVADMLPSKVEHIKIPHKKKWDCLAEKWLFQTLFWTTTVYSGCFYEGTGMSESSQRNTSSIHLLFSVCYLAKASNEKYLERIPTLQKPVFSVFPPSPFFLFWYSPFSFQCLLVFFYNTIFSLKNCFMARRNFFLFTYDLF